MKRHNLAGYYAERYYGLFCNQAPDPIRISAPKPYLKAQYPAAKRVSPQAYYRYGAPKEACIISVCKTAGNSSGKTGKNRQQYRAYVPATWKAGNTIIIFYSPKNPRTPLMGCITPDTKIMQKRIYAAPRPPVGSWQGRPPTAPKYILFPPEWIGRKITAVYTETTPERLQKRLYTIAGAGHKARHEAGNRAYEF